MDSLSVRLTLKFYCLSGKSKVLVEMKKMRSVPLLDLFTFLHPRSAVRLSTLNGTFFGDFSNAFIKKLFHLLGSGRRAVAKSTFFTLQ